MTIQSIKRLRDHPLVADLERKAALDPRLAAEGACYAFDRIDEVSRAVFGLTRDDLVITTFEDDNFEDEPGGGDDGFDEAYAMLEKPDWEQVAGFRVLGWDVTDEHGRPMLTLCHFNWQLLAAIRGEHDSKLPGNLDVPVDIWGQSIEAQARDFGRRRQIESR